MRDTRPAAAPDGATHAAADDATDEQRQLVEAAAVFANTFLRRLGALGSDGHSYPELRLIEQLHCQGPAKMRTLADGLGLTARNMTALADALEHDGLLRRVAHPTDRRATLLELTDDGMSTAEQSLGPGLAEIGRLFDQLSPDHRQSLLTSLRTLTDAMGAPGDCPG